MVFLCRMRFTASISLLVSIRALVSQHLNQDWYFYSCFVSQNLLQLLRWWQNKDKTVPLPPPKPSSPREPFGILLIFTGAILGMCSVGWCLLLKSGLAGGRRKTPLSSAAAFVPLGLCSSFATRAPGRSARPEIPVQPYVTRVTLTLRRSRSWGHGTGHTMCWEAEGVWPAGPHATTLLPPWGPAVGVC